MSVLMTITCPNRERKAILASSRHAGFIAQHCLYWNSHYWNPHLNSNQHLNTNIHTNSRHIGDQCPSKTSLNTQNTPVVRHTGITRKTIKTKICTIKASAVLHCCEKWSAIYIVPAFQLSDCPPPSKPKKGGYWSKEGYQCTKPFKLFGGIQPWAMMTVAMMTVMHLKKVLYVSGMVVMVVRHILSMWKWCCHSSHLRTQRQKKPKLCGLQDFYYKHFPVKTH